MDLAAPRHGGVEVAATIDDMGPAEGGPGRASCPNCGAELRARRFRLAVLLVVVTGCRVPAQPPGGFVTRAPAPTPEDAIESKAPAIDPLAVDEAQARAEAEARAAIEDPAACLREFSRANGFGDEGVKLRVLQSACDRAGLEARVCDPQSWLTREAAECLAKTRAMEAEAEIESRLLVDGRRGRMIWSVTGELSTHRFRRTWEVELDAQTGAMVGVRQQHQVGAEVERPTP